MSLLPLLTASRLKSARACQRKHRYEYGLGYRPAVEADALRFGTLIHLGLEAWWRGAPGDRLGDALQVLELHESDPFDKVRAQSLIVGYDARWGADCAIYEVLQVEAEFVAPLVNPETGRASLTWQLGGKLDALVREVATGRIGVVEHKTSSEDITAGTDYWRRLRMDPQVSLYYAGGEAILGRPVDFCLYDVIKKPTIRPAKATPVEDRKYTKDGRLYAKQRETDETPEEFQDRLMEAIAENPAAYYSRGEVVRLEGEVDDATFDIWQLGQQLREADRLGRYPRNPGACLQYGRTCPFFGVCSGEASLDDPTQFKKLTTQHPELAGVASAV